MSIVTKIERIERMHQMITYKRTGTPERFARKLGVSQSMLYLLINEIKGLGAPVVYCRNRESYEYLYPVEFKAGFHTSDSPRAGLPGASSSADGSKRLRAV